MFKEIFKSMMLLAATAVLAGSMLACSGNKKDEPTPKPEVPQNKIEGVMPAKVVINVYEGHLHGYSGFHQNGTAEGTKFFGVPQQFEFSLQDGKWVAASGNPKALYAMSYNKAQNTAAAAYHAIDIKYYDKDGKLLNGEFIDGGKSAHYQHFFVIKNQKNLSLFDEAIDNAAGTDFMRYDYIDPTPWNKTIHSGLAQYGGRENPLGFKGMVSFGYSRQAFDLNIMLMEAKGTKESRLINMKFNDKPKSIADWRPSAEQLKNERWYPAIVIPVVVYLDRDELERCEDLWDITEKTTMAELSPGSQRIVNTLVEGLGITEKEAITELYYKMNGDTKPESGKYWF